MNNKKLAIELILCSTLLYFSTSVYYPFISAYYQLNGLSKLEIGLITSIGPIITIIAQPVFGYLSDKLNKRKLILQILCLAAAASMLLFNLPFSFNLMIAIAVIYNIWASPIGGLTEAVTVKAADENDLKYSLIRIGGSVGFALGPIVMGPFIDSNPSIIFIFTLIGYVLLFISITLIPNENFVFVSYRKKKKDQISGIYDTSEVRIIILLTVLATVGLTISYSFFSPILLELGYTSKFIGIMAFISAVTEAIMLPVAEKFDEIFETRKLLGFCAILSGAVLLIASYKSVVMLVIAYILQGALFIIVFYVSVNYISIHTVPEKTSLGQSIMFMLKTGIGTAGANLLGGYLFDKFDIVRGLRNGGFLLMIFATFVYTLIRYAGYRVNPEEYEEDINRFGKRRQYRWVEKVINDREERNSGKRKKSSRGRK